MAKGKPFKDVPAESGEAPTFSEEFLCENWDPEDGWYKGLGKDDWRFVLGVGEEYDHIIRALGPAATKAILEVKPRLVQRLGVGKEILASLEDARDEQELHREELYPSEITVDSDAAEAIWQELHREYQRYFDPDKDMDRDKLRMYNTLTDALGEHEKRQREEEQKKRPMRLQQHEVRKEFAPKHRDAKRQIREAEKALLQAKNKTEREAASKKFIAATKLEDKLFNEEVHAMGEVRKAWEKDLDNALAT